MSFPLSDKVSSTPFTLTHTDVWGPSQLPNILEAMWFVSFTNDSARVTWLFLLKSKFNRTSMFPISTK